MATRRLGGRAGTSVHAREAVLLTVSRIYWSRARLSLHERSWGAVGWHGDQPARDTAAVPTCSGSSPSIRAIEVGTLFAGTRQAPTTDARAARADTLIGPPNFTMSEHKPSCPGCSSPISVRSVALEHRLECPTCRIGLRVPLVYQANFTIGSFTLGLVASYLLDVGPHVVEATFLLAFAFAIFLGTTVLPLVPPRLEVR